MLPDKLTKAIVVAISLICAGLAEPNSAAAIAGNPSDSSQNPTTVADTASKNDAAQLDSSASTSDQNGIWEKAGEIRQRDPAPAKAEIIPGPARPEEDSQGVDKTDYGMARGPAIGIFTRVVTANPWSDQSRFSISGMFLVPTSGVSQVRFSGGIPASKSIDFSGNSDGISQDFSLGLEHEWGLRYFGFGFGIALRHLHGFSKVAGVDTMKAPQAILFNRILSIRIGTPTIGIMGRISSLPLPVFLVNYMSGSSLANRWLDYSAFAMFGGNTVKMGLGVQGSFCRRIVEISRTAEQPYNYYTGYGQTYTYYDYTTRTESYLMFPCAKLAFLVGGHSVVTLGGDMGSTFYKRNSAGLAWAPNIMAQYAFCFGRLSGVTSMDGTF